MSDPMTNTEVEDVLASIRRLVSDDNRSEPVKNDVLPSDRLVLTPALRVTDDTAPESEPDPSERVQDQTGAPTSDNAAPDMSDMDEASRHDADLSSAADSMSADVVQDPITLDNVDLEHETLMSIQEAFDQADDVEAEAVPQTDIEILVEPEATSDEAAQQTEDHDAPLDTGEQDEVVGETEFAAEAETLSDKIAALETLIAGRTEEYEPDMPGEGANAGTEAPTIAWEDAEADTAEPQAEVPLPPEADEEEPQIFASDEDVLDEDALRDLVSDIVREELQGALGERITRNVRKLVRREIHRALAAQDLE